MLGGARSGKSSFAERLAAECGEPVLYVATATAMDQEMADRIALHRAQRPVAWQTLEEPRLVGARIAGVLGAPGEAGAAATVLVEDLTLLLSNWMAQDAATAEARALEQLHVLLAVPAHLILVSNEVGMGVVPPYPLGRVFRDMLGRLNQAAASACAEVNFLVAGLPLRLR